MTTVRVLVDAVGQYNSGDIVTDAPDGLVDIAKKKFVMRQPDNCLRKL